MSEVSQLQALQFHAAMALVDALFAAVLLLVRRWIDDAPHLALWTAAFAAGAVQWVCLMHWAASETSLPVTGPVMGPVPGPDLGPGGRAGAALLGNGLAIVSVSLLLAGERVRARLPVRGLELAGAGCVAFGAVLWFDAEAPRSGLAGAVAALYAGVLLAAAGLAPPRTDAPHPAEVALRGALVLVALLELLSGLTALGAGAGGAGDWPSRFVLLQGLALPAACSALGASMLLLVATDQARRIEALAFRDPLTGALNRRGFLDAAYGAIGLAHRGGRPVTLVLADLDHFRRVNDSYGQGAGDRALARFGAHLESELRRGDIVGRIGGQKFALLLTETDLEAGLLVAQRLRHALSIATLELRGARIRLTASFGVAELSGADGDLEDLLERADRGLYRAKETGRDRVCPAPADRRGRDYAVA